jgi:hypothetical protein
MENNVSRQAPSSVQNDRRRFLRKCLRDAQAEFDRLESSTKVIESALLTAMGALGAGCGFSGIRGPESAGIKMVGRGMDSASIERIEDDFSTACGSICVGVGHDPSPIAYRDSNHPP